MTRMAQIQSVSAWSENFPPASQWTAEDMADMSGKVCAVTGGYGGIGFETTVRVVYTNESYI